MSLLHFHAVKKIYNRRLILEIPHLTMSPGVHFVMGPNGSGKSTLLKILGGIIPFQGEIILDGNIHLQKHHRRHRQWVNYCEAEPVYPGFLRGNYLVEMFMAHKKGTVEELRCAQDLLNIHDFLDQKIDTYSSGMRKKLALLLAFIGTPGLVLLDEPFNTLDPQARAGLVQMIKQSVEEGTSFVLASHHADFSGSLEIKGLWQVDQQQFLEIDAAQAEVWMGQGLGTWEQG